jgi:hypothetical protein
MLLRLTSSNFNFAQAQDNGGDIRFASSLGKKLSYQIERWNRASQLAEVWVLADTVKGNNGTQYITMYWGNPGVASKSNGVTVFSTSNGFAGVWHLNQDPSGTGAVVLDATANANNGTSTGSMTGSELVSAIVGQGTSFNGTNQGILIPDAPSLDLTTGVTVSGWFQATALTAWTKIAGKAFTSNIAPYTMYTLGFDAGSHLSGQIDVGGTQYSVAGSTTLNTTNFFYGTFTYDNSTMKLFLNGLQEGNTTAQAGPIATDNEQFSIGMTGYGTNYFPGTLDEIQVSNIARSADWIKLCYQNQQLNQTLVDFDDYSKWPYSKKIYINTTGVTSGNVLKFPLLVRVDTTLINFGEAQSGGQDIRFSKADGTHLIYELEQWSQSNQNGAAWALVDSVFPNNGSQFIKMYWGNPGAVSKSNSSAVFDTGNGFVGVWHFTPESGTDTLRDATYNVNTGANGSTTPNTSSLIGYGRSFARASSQNVTVANAGNLQLTGNITLSAWINPTTIDTADILGKDSTAYDLEIIPTKYLRMGINKTYYLSSAASSMTTGSWYHVAVTYNSTGNPILFYANGAQLGTSVTGAAPVSTTTLVYFGARASGKYFNGNMDEPRIEKAVRSADWINLCYYTQKPSQTTAVTDSASEHFSPLAIATTYNTANQLTKVTIATHFWTVKFDSSHGGGISWLSPDSLGTGTNQLDTNLFTVLADGDSSSKGANTMKMLDSSNVFVRILQQRTIGSTNALPYSILYTVLGSGKVFVRVSTYATAAKTPSGGLEFRIGTNATSNITNYYPTSAASNCNYLLHSNSTTNPSTWLDPCLALFQNWSQATTITGTASGRYVGLQSSNWSTPPNRTHGWDFMIDFTHRNWNDSTGVGAYISEYANPDSLMFYAGTPYLEKSWESQLSGHWKFEEGGGTTAYDNSGSSDSGIATPTSTWTWSGGKWGGGLALGMGDSVKIADNTILNSGTGTTGFTILSWVRPSIPLTGASTIFEKLGSGGTGYKFTGGSNGVVQLSLGATNFSGRTSIGANTWRHVGAMYKKVSGYDTVKIYVDGKPDTVITNSTNFSFTPSGSNAYMGGINATLDDVRFYNECMNDEDVRTIYELGYAANQGMYFVRADNNSAVNCVIDGSVFQRHFPVFQVTNYFAAGALSATNPYVYVNGSPLTYNKDYYAMLDANTKKLTVGFNRSLNTPTQIYIGTNTTVATTTTAMPQMSWGSYASPTPHFYVKNFSGDIFGGASANQFYADFKIDSSVNSNCGEIYRLKTSKISPLGTADTSSTGTLVSVTSSTDSASFGCAKFKIGGHWLKSTADIAAAPTYTVVESSAVRVVLQINNRTLKNTADSCNIRTWFTFYPTGQIFRWDSVTIPNATVNIDTVRYDVLEKYVASGAGTGRPASPVAGPNQYGGLYGATNIQDFAAVLLALDTLNGSVYGMKAPSLLDTSEAYSVASAPNNGIGERFVHCGRLLNANQPYQAAVYMDIDRATFTSALIDSLGLGMLKKIGSSPTSMLTANGNGSTVLNSTGDFDGDGFNEREGAFIYQADNTNTAHFKLTADSTTAGDTCRFYPAFRITNYTATAVPQYVYVNNQQIVQGFGYNAYLKQSTRELILQINQKFCTTADIYISSNTTLAVTMDDFNANGGDGLVRVLWNTESEENNLGFYIYRRIRPLFADSLLMSPASALSISDTLGNAANEKTPVQLFRSGVIGMKDTTWTQVNQQIIYGALAGVSFGKRSYSMVDRGVHNSVQYEYKLVSVDYSNNRDPFGKLAEARPHQILPTAFYLHENYPNPFRGITYLKFDVPVKTRAMLNVYSMQGRLLRHIVKPDNSMNPGFYSVMWDRKDDAGRLMASGPYIYRFSAPGFAKAKVMIVMK